MSNEYESDSGDFSSDLSLSSIPSSPVDTTRPPTPALNTFQELNAQADEDNANGTLIGEITVAECSRRVDQLQRQLNDNNILVLSLVEASLEMGDGKLSADLQQRLQHLRHSFETKPGILIHEMMQIVKGAKYSRDTAQQNLQALMNGRLFEPGAQLHFPLAPVKSQIEDAWTHISTELKEAWIDHDTCSVTHLQMLTAYGAGYTASCIDQVMDGDSSQWRTRIASISEISNPHIARAMLGAISLRAVFSTPDPVCEGQHTQLLLGSYQSDWITASPLAVKRQDAHNFTLWFKDRESELKVAMSANHLANDIQLLIKSAQPYSAGILDADNWAIAALELRQKLQLSPKEYKIYYIEPGTLFDASYMTAEALTGCRLHPKEAAGRQVALCIFPMLVEMEEQEIHEDAVVEDVLLKNKVFLPRWRERWDCGAGGVVGKAVVLVDG